MIENLIGQRNSVFSTPPVFSFPLKIVRVNLALLKMRMAESGIVDIAFCYLCREERERFHAFRYEKRKTEWLAGRIAAKCAGLQLHNNDEQICREKKQWHQLQISADNSGKPIVIWFSMESSSTVCISISHSKGFAVAIAARENCGVDIQQVTPAVERVEERFVTSEEKNILAEISDLYGRRAALTLLWSAKEAVKKTSAGAFLPGFLDIRLKSLQKSGDAFLFAVNVQYKESIQNVSQLIWVKLLDGFSYAVTTRNQGRI